MVTIHKYKINPILMVTKNPAVQIVQVFSHEGRIMCLAQDQIIYHYDPCNGEWFREKFDSERSNEPTPVPYVQDNSSLDPY